MTSSLISSKIRDTCWVNLLVGKKIYTNMKLAILDNLCCDILLCHDFLRRYYSVSISFVETLPELIVLCVVSIGIQPPFLFTRLSAKCKPIAVRSRRFSDTDIFIASDTTRLLRGVIESMNLLAKFKFWSLQEKSMNEK